jgi:putative ABC transport system permease protein
MLTVTLAGLRLRWRRLLLSAVAVGLGVAFTAATLIYTATVNAAYYAQYAAEAKNVDAAVLPGSGPTVPLSDLAAVRAVPGAAAVEGRLQGPLTLIGAGGRTDAATAIDRPADPRFRFYTVVAGGGSVLLDEDTAVLDHVRPGTAITVADQDGRTRRLVVTGIAGLGASGRVLGGAVMILPAPLVRSLTGAGGYQRIDVAAAPGVSQAALAAALAGRRLPGTTTETGARLAGVLAEQNAGGEGLLSIGLRIFAAVSLIVAALVIYNSFRILLAQRLRETALLRCVGATRRQLLADILAESAGMGLAAGAAGIAAATALVAAVNGGAVSLTGGTVAVSLLIAVLVTSAAALFPAVAASRTAPVAALQVPPEGGGRGRAVRIAAAALLAGLGLALTAAGMPRGEAGLVMIAAGGTIVFLGFLVIGPLVAGPITSALGWLPSRVLGIRMRLAVTGARRNPGRTAVTAAALTIGIGLMTLFSVVLSTATQLADSETNSHFPADYLLTAQGSETGSGIPPAVLAALRSSPLIAQTAAARQRTAAVNGVDAQVMAVQPSADGSLFLPDVTSGSLTEVAAGTGEIALNGAEARRLGVAVGGRVTITGRSFLVAAIFSDGVLDEDALISWPDFTRAFGSTQADAEAGAEADAEAADVLVKARTGVPATASAGAVDTAIAADPAIEVTSEASLRAHMLSSVHKLTDLLDGLLATSIVIALTGMANTLSLSVLERTRESALLRALGLTRGQLRQMISLEAVLLGVMGALVGVAFGLGFGWATGRAFLRTHDVAVSFPFLQIAGYVVLAGLAALLASLIPARRAARRSVIEGLAPE